MSLHQLTSFHIENGQRYLQQDLEIPSENNESDLFLIIHGWALWVAWGLLGFIQIWSTRYLRHHWKINMWIHAIVGTIIFVFNLIYGFGAIYYLDWQIEISIHGIVGTIMSVLMAITFFEGMLAHFLFRNIRWNNALLVKISYAHKYLSYFVLLAGNLAIVGGTISYYKNDISASYLCFIHIAIFYTFLAFYEILFRIRLRKEVPFIHLRNKITFEEFCKRVSKGEQLTILNDLVLDVKAYQFSHPGGSFLIEKNVGRDISKYFDGGYQMENNKGLLPFTHSNIARKIVNQLAIGQLVSKAPVFQAYIESRHPVNKYTSTFVFKTKEPIKGVKKYYSEFSMLGRHYLITSEKLPDLRRYFTISNCMIPEIYQEYLRVIYEAVKKDNICFFDNTLFTEEDVSTVALTIKTYNKIGGMSQLIFSVNDYENIFYLSGPMGKGLQVERQGIHIAFTAGTGCLLFLDLVAHLIRKNVNQLSKEEDEKLDQHNFKFVLYMSFQSRRYSCGLEICEGLQQLCQKFNFKNFELHTRFSENFQEKWDYKYIDNELMHLSVKQIKKIWVCGPPTMNETFDQAFEELGPKYNISRHCIDVL